MAVVRLTPILPKKADIAALRAGVRNAANETNRILKTQFARTTRTWRNKPRFESTVTTRPNETIANTGTENEIYGYVSNGTRIRYAVMTPDFVSKTVPRVVPSRAGAGGFSHFSFRQPRPGIEAREFDRIIAHDQTPNIVRILRQELERAVRNSGAA